MISILGVELQHSIQNFAFLEIKIQLSTTSKFWVPIYSKIFPKFYRIMIRYHGTVQMLFIKRHGFWHRIKIYPKNDYFVRSSGALLFDPWVNLEGKCYIYFLRMHFFLICGQFPRTLRMMVQTSFCLLDLLCFLTFHYHKQHHPAVYFWLPYKSLFYRLG